MQRNQSEDYSRPEDVLVYRDHPSGVGYEVTRMVDEPANTRVHYHNAALDAAPLKTWVLVAAEALWLASPLAFHLDITVDDLREQLILDRGVRFADKRIAEVAYDTLDASPVRIGACRVDAAFFRAAHHLDTNFSRLS